MVVAVVVVRREESSFSPPVTLSITARFPLMEAMALQEAAQREQGIKVEEEAAVVGAGEKLC